MANFQRTLVAEDGIAKIRSDALGTGAGEFTDTSVGLLVKLGANACVLCADGDEILGQVQSVAEHTVNSGYSFGAVKQSHRIKVKVAAQQTGNMAVGDLCVAGTQPAHSAGTGGTAKTGTPTRHKWECIWVSGSGAAGDEAILEKV